MLTGLLVAAALGLTPTMYPPPGPELTYSPARLAGRELQQWNALWGEHAAYVRLTDGQRVLAEGMGYAPPRAAARGELPPARWHRYVFTGLAPRTTLALAYGVRRGEGRAWVLRTDARGPRVVFAGRALAGEVRVLGELAWRELRRVAQEEAYAGHGLGAQRAAERLPMAFFR